MTGSARNETRRSVIGPQYQPWTLVHGFYAQMGGFVLDTFNAFPEVLPETRDTLDLESFRVLLQYSRKPFPEFQSDRKRDHVEVIRHVHGSNRELEAEDRIQPDADCKGAHGLLASNIYEKLQISEKDILDKSKASGLAKALVCAQALWFCIQCLSRILQSLPITLLELNTFAHCLCALIIYLLWWHKPLGIEEATTLPIRDSHAVKLWACLNQGNSVYGTHRRTKTTISQILRRIKWWFTFSARFEILPGDLRGDLQQNISGQSKIPRYSYLRFCY